MVVAAIGYFRLVGHRKVFFFRSLAASQKARIVAFIWLAYLSTRRSEVFISHFDWLREPHCYALRHFDAIFANSAGTHLVFHHRALLSEMLFRRVKCAVRVLFSQSNETTDLFSASFLFCCCCCSTTQQKTNTSDDSTALCSMRDPRICDFCVCIRTDFVTTNIIFDNVLLICVHCIQTQHHLCLSE